MIADRGLVALQIEGSPYRGAPRLRADAERYLDARMKWPAALRTETYLIVPLPSCRCCGEPAEANLRCAKHRDRNPCLVEGCRRTRHAGRGELADDQVICGAHWRAYVPPGSAMRRTYHRFWRLAKRQGWSPELIARFRRFWRALVKRVRQRAAEGFLDQREIERLFGWGGGA